MSEALNNPLPPELATAEEHQSATGEEVSKYAYERYVHGTHDFSPGMLLWHENMLYRSPRSSYQLAAGSCQVDAALHPAGDYGLDARLNLINDATLNWERTFEQEKDATNDLAERAKWALCQVPMFNAIASFIEGEEIDRSKLQTEQEALFVEHLNHLLLRWPHEELEGHAMEVLTSYFSHRSNRMRPNEQPIFSVPSSLRYDYHPEANKRVDVDVYDLRIGIKYGIQVKGGKGSNPDKPDSGDHPLFRIFLKRARQLFSLPGSDENLLRTIKAITTNDPQYRNDIDTIAANNRALIVRHFGLPRYVGMSVLRRESSGLS